MNTFYYDKLNNKVQEREPNKPKLNDFSRGLGYHEAEWQVYKERMASLRSYPIAPGTENQWPEGDLQEGIHFRMDKDYSSGKAVSTAYPLPAKEPDPMEKKQLLEGFLKFIGLKQWFVEDDGTVWENAFAGGTKIENPVEKYLATLTNDKKE